MLTWEEAVSLYNPINIVEAYQEEEGVTKASQQHHNNTTTSSFLPFLKASSSFLAMLRSCHYLLVFFLVWCSHDTANDSERGGGGQSSLSARSDNKITPLMCTLGVKKIYTVMV